MKSTLLVFCLLAGSCWGGVVSVANSSAGHVRVTFSDGEFCGALVVPPRSQGQADVPIEATSWTATIETSTDGTTYSTPTGGTVTGEADFLFRANLSVHWDGSAVSVRYWRQDYEFYLQGVILGLGCFVPMFGLWLLMTSIRKGLTLGSEGAP